MKMATALNNLEYRELNATSDMLVIMLDNLGRIIFFNKACELATGYTFKEVLNHKFWDYIVSSEEAEQIKQGLEDFNADRFPRRLTNQLVTKNGEKRIVRWTNNVLLNREEKADRVVFYGRDVTDGDGQEQEVPQALPQLLSGAGLGRHCFWITNSSGKILDASDSYCALTGHTRPELLKMTISDIDANLKPQDVKAHVQGLMKEGSKYFSSNHKCRGGGRIDLQVLANYTEAFGGLIFFTSTSLQDEKERSPQATRFAEQKNIIKAKMLDYSNDAIFIHDFNGNFTFINKTACAKLGCSKEELMDMNLADFTVLRDPDYMEQHIKQLIENGNVCYRGDYICKNGVSIRVDVKSQVMDFGNKKLILTVAQDITEIEELRNERKASAEKTVMPADAGAEAKPAATEAPAGEIPELQKPEGEVNGQKVAEGGTAEINDKLVKWLSVLDQSRNGIALAGKMGIFLQSCIHMPEADRVITQFLPVLFPSIDGALYLLNNGTDTYELTSSWGKTVESDESFVPDACWAIRRRKAHHFKAGDTEELCSHCTKGMKRGYIDIPLTSQGKILGLLHLEDKDGAEPQDDDNALTGFSKNLAMIVAGQLAFALANIRLQETVREQAIRDGLTGLYNRLYMEQALDKELRQAARNNASVGVITLDLDSFGKFNDRHGYKSGNIIMRNLGEFLKSNGHPDDIICRGNGDEFAIICPRVSPDTLKGRAEGILEGLTYFNKRHQDIYQEPLTMSLGIAIFPQNGSTPEQIIKLADMASNQAEQEGGNKIVLAESKPAKAE
jgi:diguanylate cyclase (GGDEF)-like protein/PAS domain S-box-containing protein